MDYRKFLAADESLVLPYTGGQHVETDGRRLRLTRPVEPGWWRFAIKGRRAEPEAVDTAPEALQERPAVRGHTVDGWLFMSGREEEKDRLGRPGRPGRLERLELLPTEELPPLSPVRARRWHDGVLLFDCTEFEETAEEEARLALEDRRPIGEVKGVSASLRAAYGYALVLATSRTLDIPVSPREVQADVLVLAEQGAPAAEALLRRLDGERRAHEAEVQARLREEQVLREELRLEEQREREWQSHEHQVQAEARIHIEVARAGRGAPRGRDRTRYQDRAEKALVAAGATPLAMRFLEDARFEVTFRFMGQRFISVVDTATLQVHDSGICLSGSDRMLTLESLPSAIREAIDTGKLVIMRR